ncbi:hypothetical protein [Nocardia arizonensis]|uniref:hypothetical protein n=1 Tax=Nocardia arizonensis TaxID=1141647 RepID=UPI0006D07598|nr:hypothetical protein [Nocardia arizonensis]
MNRSRGSGLGLTVFAAATAVTVLAAPSASAAVDSVTVSGTGYVVGSTYTIEAQLSGASAGLLVYFSDNGEFIGAPQVPWPPGHASISWKPSTAGQHIITVEQGGSTKTTVVDVTKPGQTGSGSASSGSAGSGSANSGSVSTGSAATVLAAVLGKLLGQLFGGVLTGS